MTPVAKDLRAIALYEMTKGALVLLAGAGVLHYSHIDPIQKVPQVFQQLLVDVGDLGTWMVALAVLAYAALRFVLAWGLWNERTWALWLGAGAGLIYVPLELLELARAVTLFRTALLLGNLAVVAFLLWRLRQIDRSVP